jgi:hypothetical protein
VRIRIERDDNTAPEAGRDGRQPSKRRRPLVLVASLAALTLVIAGSVTLSAVAATSTTYFACLSNGQLTKVATTAPKCTAPAKQISWNSVGPAGTNGTTILSGAAAPGPSIGLVGDYYLDTATHVLFGPATRSCSPLPCKTFWGQGTSLIGPAGAPGAAGQTVVYETGAHEVVLPNGNSRAITVQTIPVTGDYSVVAGVELNQGENTGASWDCTLFAANPGGTAVVLDEQVVTSAGPGFPPNVATMTLRGVVSLAANGTISVDCEEAEARENDSAGAQIDTTQISKFVMLPSG